MRRNLSAAIKFLLLLMISLKVVDCDQQTVLKAMTPFRESRSTRKRVGTSQVRNAGDATLATR